MCVLSLTALLILADLQIASSIIDSTTWRDQRNLDHLPGFIENFTTYNAKDIPLNEAARDKGSPHTLVVTGAGLRAADLTRALRKFQTKDAKVEKLFAKHIKLKEAIESARKSRISIGVGTPQRISDLLIRCPEIETHQEDSGRCFTHRYEEAWCAGHEGDPCATHGPALSQGVQGEVHGRPEPAAIAVLLARYPDNDNLVGSARGICSSWENFRSLE